MPKKPKLIPPIKATTKQIVKAIFAENIEFAKQQRAKRKKDKKANDNK